LGAPLTGKGKINHVGGRAIEYTAVSNGARSFNRRDALDSYITPSGPFIQSIAPLVFPTVVLSMQLENPGSDGATISLALLAPELFRQADCLGI